MLHEPGKVRLARPHEQVQVGSLQRIRVNLDAKRVGHGAQPPKKRLAIPVVREYMLPAIATAHDVIP